MGSAPLVLVHAGPDLLAEAAAARLALRLADAQAGGGTAAVVLTGGTIAARMYAALRNSPLRGVVDWSRVDFWWGDERFVPAGDPDRNDGQAWAALLDALPVSAARVHPMPAAVPGLSAEAGAAAYAEELGATPRFDVVLLGVGEDGHVASVFPGHPVTGATGVAAAVHDSPKPPPDRITLTLPVLNTADEVWLIAAGAGKADAVGAALRGSSRPEGTGRAGDNGVLPAAQVCGVSRTVWLLDAAAAANL